MSEVEVNEILNNIRNAVLDKLVNSPIYTYEDSLINNRLVLENGQLVINSKETKND